MPNLTSTQAASIETHNAANLKAAHNGDTLMAVFYHPVILVGSTANEEANHDPAIVAWLKTNSTNVTPRHGTVKIKKGSLTGGAGSLTFAGGLASTPAEAKTWLANITKKKLI